MIKWGVGVQRLEMMVAVVLAHERRAPTDTADGCATLAAARSVLPSRPLELIAEAVAALGYTEVRARTCA